jgi:hypothetical protein
MSGPTGPTGATGPTAPLAHDSAGVTGAAGVTDAAGPTGATAVVVSSTMPLYRMGEAPLHEYEPVVFAQVGPGPYIAPHLNIPLVTPLDFAYLIIALWILAACALLASRRITFRTVALFTNCLLSAS